MADSIKEAQNAGIPATTLDHLLAVGYVKGVDPASMAGFIQTLTQVKRENLPVEPFVNKIKEGMARQAPAPVIQQALTKKREDYLFTQTTLKETLKRKGKDEAIPNEHFVRLAESLSCGVSRENLRHYLEQAPSSSTSSQLANTVETAASLQQYKFDPEMTEKIVMNGLKQNYFTPETKDFSRVMGTAKRKGVPDQKIADTALNAIRNRDSVRSMASHLGVSKADPLRGPGARSDQTKIVGEAAGDRRKGGGAKTHEGMGSDRRGRRSGRDKDDDRAVGEAAGDRRKGGGAKTHEGKVVDMPPARERGSDRNGHVGSGRDRDDDRDDDGDDDRGDDRDDRGDDGDDRGDDGDDRGDDGDDRGDDGDDRGDDGDDD